MATVIKEATRTGVRVKGCRFPQSERIQALARRSRELAISGKRRLTGFVASDGAEEFSYGDHACWIDIGPFPELDRLPSRLDGYEPSGESWARDYGFLMDNSPIDIYPHERIVGEIHWEMHMVRKYEWPERVLEIVREANELGAMPASSQHTCPDLAIGLTEGWAGILARVKESRDKYTRLDNQERASYLAGLQTICEASIRFINRYAEKARDLAGNETDANRKEELLRIAECCGHIALHAPRTYYEGVQWIHFAVLLDRVVGHGNGYGRLDLYLIDLYRASRSAGELTDEEARELLSEMFLKLRGQFFSVGGRDSRLNDASNEMSFVVLEGYDLIGDYNNLGVMWHSDIRPDFYEYACDVLARHGEAIPVLVNHDLMREAELRSGIPEHDAWKVSYSGCQWFCIPGMEYCDHDVNNITLIKPMDRALRSAAGGPCPDFDALYSLFEEELARTCTAMRVSKQAQYDLLPSLWPEMATSLNCHGPVERGLDMVAARGVDYQYTSVNVLGIPNVADSLHAIRRLVFDEGRYTLSEVVDAVDSNWAGQEPMRQEFLNEDKFGNDRDEVDAIFVRVTESIACAFGGMVNQRGLPFRASLYSFSFHINPNRPGAMTVRGLEFGATPDGRRAEENLAQGINPQVGRATRGLLPMANSQSRVDHRKFQGGSLQVDLQPRFFDGNEATGAYVRDFSTAFFRKGGMQINLNIMDIEKLRDAIEHPENPDYQDIVIRVTGYASRFVSLNRSYQEDFVERLSRGAS